MTLSGRLLHAAVVTVRRLFLMFLLVYITSDFVDPSVPGVFFFDSETLFVDGLIQAKSDAPERASHAATPIPARLRETVDVRLPMRELRSTPVRIERHTARSDLDSSWFSSFPSASSEDH